MTDYKIYDDVNKHAQLSKELQKNGINHQFSIIQETICPNNKVDLYFNVDLWTTLFEIFHQKYREMEWSYVEDRTPTLFERFLGPKISLGYKEQRIVNPTEFKQSISNEDEPPLLLFAREGGKLIFCIETQFWCRAGGPEPFHDSYTYVIYSQTPLLEDTVSALKLKI